MAPKYMKNPNPGEGWYKGAYEGDAGKDVQFQLLFNKEVINSGDRIQVKYQRGIFKFRCLVHNIKDDITWFDCLNESTGEWRSFSLNKLKGPVKKRSRRKKNV